MTSRLRGPLGELVTFENDSGHRLDGILYLAGTNLPTVVHVHGSYGNFYQNAFVRMMAAACLDARINFLSFNTSAHDGVAEGYGPGNDFRYVGGGIVPFAQSVADVGAAVRFAEEFSNRVVLQGHSLGCDRVISYLLDAARPLDCVLLAPCDSHRLQSNLIRPETVEHQIARLRSVLTSRTAFDWLPAAEYGVDAGPEWTYPNPITRSALLSILEGPPFTLFRYENETPSWELDDSNALLIIGRADSLITAPPERVAIYLTKGFATLAHTFVDDADHMLAGHEESVAARIISWVEASRRGA